MTAHYRLTRRAFINGAVQPEGTELDFDGAPNEFMIPLNSEAEEKMKDFPGIKEVIAAEHAAQAAAKGATGAVSPEPVPGSPKPAEPKVNPVPDTTKPVVPTGPTGPAAPTGSTGSTGKK